MLNNISLSRLARGPLRLSGLVLASDYVRQREAGVVSATAVEALVGAIYTSIGS